MCMTYATLLRHIIFSLAMFSFGFCQTEYLTIDPDRLNAQADIWTARFASQKVRRYVTVGGLVAATAALAGTWYWLSSEDKPVASSSTSPLPPQPEVGAPHFSFEEWYCKQWQADRDEKRTFGYHCKNALQNGLANAVMITVAGVAGAVFSGTGSWVWDKVKKGFGFADDLELKALISEFCTNAARYVTTSQNLLSMNLPIMQAELKERLVAQKMYGYQIDHRAFVVSLERCLGFVIASLQYRDVSEQDRLAMMHSLQRLIELFNQSLLYQYAQAQACLRFEKGIDGTSPLVLHGVCQEGVRLLNDVGTLTFGKEFNAQATAVA